jgi:hypothetical protein
MSTSTRLYLLIASLGVFGCIAFASPSQARIVYTNTLVTLKDDGDMPIDINNDGVTDFIIDQSFGACNASAVIQVKSGDGVAFGNVGPDGPWASALKSGDLIGPALSFTAAVPELVDDYGGPGCGPFSHSYGFWQDIGPAYIGVEFTKNHKLHYGWAALQVTFVHFGRPMMSTVLSGYAYETIVGKAIAAGKT